MQPRIARRPKPKSHDSRHRPSLAAFRQMPPAADFTIVDPKALGPIALRPSPISIRLLKRIVPNLPIAGSPIMPSHLPVAFRALGHGDPPFAVVDISEAYLPFGMNVCATPPFHVLVTYRYPPSILTRTILSE